MPFSMAIVSLCVASSPSDGVRSRGSHASSSDFLKYVRRSHESGVQSFHIYTCTTLVLRLVASAVPATKACAGVGVSSATL